MFSHVTDFYFTDQVCDVCGCASEEDSETILYCDLCDRSFHISCLSPSPFAIPASFVCMHCTCCESCQGNTTTTRAVAVTPQPYAVTPTTPGADPNSPLHGHATDLSSPSSSPLTVMASRVTDLTTVSALASPAADRRMIASDGELSPAEAHADDATEQHAMQIAEPSPLSQSHSTDLLSSTPLTSVEVSVAVRATTTLGETAKEVRIGVLTHAHIASPSPVPSGGETAKPQLTQTQRGSGGPRAKSPAVTTGVKNHHLRGRKGAGGGGGGGKFASGDGRHIRTMVETVTVYEPTWGVVDTECVRCQRNKEMARQAALALAERDAKFAAQRQLRLEKELRWAELQREEEARHRREKEEQQRAAELIKLQQYESLKNVCGSCSEDCSECSVLCMGCHRNHHIECTAATYEPWLSDMADGFRCTSCLQIYPHASIGIATTTTTATAAGERGRGQVSTSTRSAIRPSDLSDTAPSGSHRGYKTHLGSGSEAMVLLNQVAKIQRIRVIQRAEATKKKFTAEIDKEFGIRKTDLERFYFKVFRIPEIRSVLNSHAHVSKFSSSTSCLI